MSMQCARTSYESCDENAHKVNVEIFFLLLFLAEDSSVYCLVPLSFDSTAYEQQDLSHR